MSIFQRGLLISRVQIKVKHLLLIFQEICNAEILQIFHRNADVELERKTRAAVDLLRLTCVMFDRQIIITAAHRHEYIDP